MQNEIQSIKSQIEPNIRRLAIIRKLKFWNFMSLSSFWMLTSIWGEIDNFSEIEFTPGEIYVSPKCFLTPWYLILLSLY